MKKIFLLMCLLWFVLLSVKTLAAPAPWGIAVNLEKGECAGYWAGDEFVGYGLPDGWEDYYPDYIYGDGDNRIIIGDRLCYFGEGNERECCEELGLKFVSENIGKDGATFYVTLAPTDTNPLLGGLLDPVKALILVVCCCLVLLAGGGTSLFLLSRKRKQTQVAK